MPSRSTTHASILTRPPVCPVGLILSEHPKLCIHLTGADPEPQPAAAARETHAHCSKPCARSLWKRPLGNPTMKSSGAKSDTTVQGLLSGVWNRLVGGPTC